MGKFHKLFIFLLVYLVYQTIYQKSPFPQMKLLIQSCTSATIHLDGALLQTCGKPLSNNGLLVQVWFNKNDTLDDATYSGRAVMQNKLWPSKSLKRPRPCVRNSREMKCDVLFVFHRDTDDATTSSDTSSITSSIKTTDTNTTNATNIESLAFRRLFREVVFRAQVEYSSDKTIRTKFVRGVVIQKNRHKMIATYDTIANIDMDTATLTIPRGNTSKKRSNNPKDGSLDRPKKKSSSSKVLARSTPIDLSSIQKNPSSTSTSTSTSTTASTLVPFNNLITPVIERDHVHSVYDTIADHWDGTRYAPWPRVVEFIQSLKPGALIADVGCGNGKYMQSTYIGRNDR